MSRGPLRAVRGRRVHTRRRRDGRARNQFPRLGFLGLRGAAPVSREPVRRPHRPAAVALLLVRGDGRRAPDPRPRHAGRPARAYAPAGPDTAGPARGRRDRIHRDLTTLARNRAICDVLLVSAEEDLAQVIADVQDLGIRVMIAHISVDGNWTVSRPLRQQCDDIVQIDGTQLQPYVELIAGAEPTRYDEPYPASVYGGKPLTNGHAASAGGGGHPGLPSSFTGQPPPGSYTAPVVTEYQPPARGVGAGSPGMGRRGRPGCCRMRRPIAGSAPGIRGIGRALPGSPGRPAGAGSCPRRSTAPRRAAPVQAHPGPAAGPSPAGLRFAAQAAADPHAVAPPPRPAGARRAAPPVRAIGSGLLDRSGGRPWRSRSARAVHQLAADLPGRRGGHRRTACTPIPVETRGTQTGGMRTACRCCSRRNLGRSSRPSGSRPAPDGLYPAARFLRRSAASPLDGRKGLAVGPRAGTVEMAHSEGLTSVSRWPMTPRRSGWRRCWPGSRACLRISRPASWRARPCPSMLCCMTRCGRRCAVDSGMRLNVLADSYRFAAAAGHWPHRLSREPASRPA